MKVVISGSFRKHLIEIGNVRERLLLAGVEILSPTSAKAMTSKGDFVFLATDRTGESPFELEQRFLEQIVKADILYMVNTNGYIGISVAAEIAYARLNNIPAIISEPINKFGEGIPEPVSNLIMRIPLMTLPPEEIVADRMTLLMEELTRLKYDKLLDSDGVILARLIESLLQDLKRI